MSHIILGSLLLLLAGTMAFKHHHRHFGWRRLIGKLDATPAQERAIRDLLHFFPFERAGKSAGLGLGLALVERIARAHSGRAFVESGVTRGASVGFTIPLEQ